MSEIIKEDDTLPDFFITSMECNDDDNSSPKLIVSESLTDTDELPDQAEKSGSTVDAITMTTESVTSFQDGQEVQLDDGSTALIFHNSEDASDCPLELVQQVQLDNGTVAYLCQQKQISTSLQSTADLKNCQKAFPCDHPDCKKVYSTAHHLKVHKRTHTGEKPFVCKWSECKKVFSTSYALKSHYRVHTGEKPYPCPHVQCKKAFKTSGDLQKHIRTHTGEKPFKCPFEGCGKAFTTSNICKVHIRTHTGERPHKCPHADCSKSFTNMTNFKNHMRIHTGEKPYVCEVKNCGKQFTEYSSLHKHQVVHCVTKPYMCLVCGKMYRQPSTLALHHRKAHKGRPNPPVVKKQDATPPAVEGHGKSSRDSSLATKQTTESAPSNTSNHVNSAASSLQLPAATALPNATSSLDVPQFSIPLSMQDGTIYLNRNPTSFSESAKQNSDTVADDVASTIEVKSFSENSDIWLTDAPNTVIGDKSDDLTLSRPIATFELNGAKFVVQMVSDDGNAMVVKSPPTMQPGTSSTQGESFQMYGEDQSLAPSGDSAAETAPFDKGNFAKSEDFFVVDASASGLVGACGQVGNSGFGADEDRAPLLSAEVSSATGNLSS